MRPDTFPDWSLLDKVDTISGQNNVVEPDSGYKNYGWLFREKPPRNYDNWFKRIAGQWIRHIDASLYERIAGMQVIRSDVQSISISPGKARGIGGNADTIVLGSFLRKTDATWSSGHNGGGVPAALFPMVDGTWYHFFVVKRDSDGAVDAGFDTDIDAVNLLAQWAGQQFQYRRVGTVYRTAGIFRAFIHNMNSGWFRHDPGIRAVTSLGVTQGIHLIPMTIGVPPGLRLLADINIGITAHTTAAVVVLSDSELFSQTTDGHQVLVPAAGLKNLSCLLTTDTQSRISMSVNVPTTTVDFELYNLGYLDPRYIAPETWM